MQQKNELPQVKHLAYNMPQAADTHVWDQSCHPEHSNWMKENIHLVHITYNNLVEDTESCFQTMTSGALTNV
jgi:hypothetical protein